MKIVFTGITGLLGKYFFKNRRQGFEIFGVNRKNCDITDKNSILNFIKKINPQIIVHAASIGDVDYCERHPEEAYLVNVQGTKNILKAANKIKSKIIFLSSNAIYDGENPPYNEESLLNPVDIYGKTKMEAEDLIKKSRLNFCILRLITMYGWPQPGGRNNPVTWVIDKLKNRERINVVNDIYNNHLWAGQAAQVLWTVIEKNKKGIFNIAGKDCVSRFDLALKVAKVFNLDESLISAVTSDFFKAIAKRPKNTSFKTAKMKKILGIKPLSIENGLLLMKQEMHSTL